MYPAYKHPTLSSDSDLKQAHDLLALWVCTLTTETPEAAAALYAPGATLLPTLSDQVLHSFTDFQDYYQRLMALPNLSIAIHAAYPCSLEGRFLVNSGSYTFHFNSPETGEPDSIPARFTFLYQKLDENTWKILHHHSSREPIPL